MVIFFFFNRVFKYIKSLRGSHSTGLLVNRALQSLIFNQLSYLYKEWNFYSVGNLVFKWSHPLSQEGVFLTPPDTVWPPTDVGGKCCWRPEVCEFWESTYA